MLRHLLRWLVPLVLALTYWLGSARAQNEVPRGAQNMGGGDASTTESGHNPAPAYVFAVLATLLVLTIVCMPSRKA